MYDFVLIFILGGFGVTWWPGIEIDAPRPGGGGDGEPGWPRLVALAVGGISAVLVSTLTNGLANPALGIPVAIAAGKFGSAIFGGLRGAFRGR